MTKIDSKEVAKLRQATGVGMMTAKEALVEAGGYPDKAMNILKDKAKIKSAKKKEREIKAGYIDTYSHGGRVGVMVKMGTETDFVAKNDQFRKIAHDIALQIASMNPESVEELLKQPFIKDQNKTIEDIINELVAKIGERIEVVEFVRYEI